MKVEIEFIPYGEIRSRARDSWQALSRLGHARISRPRENSRHVGRRVFVTFSQDLDESFVELFRRWTAHDTRLLILNEGASTDRLLSRILDLQIRTPQRCYVVEGKFGAGKSTFAATLIRSLLERLASSLEANDDTENRVLDARVENGILRVVSPNFERLDVPIGRIPQFKDADASELQEFEIDEDGAFIYWPELDVHLGWAQLQQVVDPKAALKAAQKSGEFNKRYGKAVQKLRESTRLKRAGIPGLSEKQIGRIENGECRLTANAIETLAKAHDLAPNDYMKKLAEAQE
ncbi:MAG TPA: DUF2442 domain-containing protein [Methylomirabilota bacterium]|nr:DUF2442 domain-containing protein [Methylomirabilota bacterium]